LEILEALSYVITIVGLPFAIWLFFHERTKEREQDDEETFLALSDDYLKFLEMSLSHADLHLFSPYEERELTAEQTERRLILFEMLVSIFERAYILVSTVDVPSPQNARLWNTWQDYIQTWCRRPDFRATLPGLLQGEDPEFVEYITRQVAQYTAP
jgi:hypothetical protein